MGRNQRMIIQWMQSEPRVMWHDTVAVAAAVNMPVSVARRALNSLVENGYLKTGRSTTGLTLYMRTQ